MASAWPLCAAKVRSAPPGSSNRTRGSVVARPSASMTVPSGTGTPEFSATRALPCAIALVAKSSRIGSPFARGMPTVNGLVTNRACAPPCGATTG